MKKIVTVSLLAATILIIGVVGYFYKSGNNVVKGQEFSSLALTPIFHHSNTGIMGLLLGLILI